MDNNYQTYLNRVMRLTLPETYASQVQHIQESPKFKLLSEGFQPVSFPGYTVITPPWEDESKNTDTYLQLKSYQQELIDRLPAGLLVPLPPESFHLTLADLIWDGAYLEATQNPEFEAQLQRCIAQSFQTYQQSLADDSRPVQLQVVGLVVMPRAIGVCLIPREEAVYDRLLDLRRAIYQNPDLIALGIEQQYHFTAHITLGYFGTIPPDLDRAQLSQIFNELNQKWLEVGKQDFWVHQAELRKFDNMTHYYRESNFPICEF